MKTKLTLLSTFTAVVVLLAGCKLLGANPTPPTPLEQKIFNVQTNFVIATNVVTETLERTNTITLTNTVDNTVTTTNVVTPQTVFETNIVQKEVYTLTPNATSQAVAQTAGSVGNAVMPGSGDLISLIILAALGAWGHLRSYKAGQTVATQTATAQALVQEMETVLAVVGKLPNGQTIVPALTKFLNDHQSETGVVQNVLDVIKNDLNNQQAQGAATEIQTLIASLNQATGTTPK